MKLHDKALAEVRHLSVLIDHYEQSAQQMRARVIQLVEAATGVDMQQGNFTLDIETGEVVDGSPTE